MFAIGTPKTDTAYWSTSTGIRIYLRILYAACAFLYSAMFLGAMKAPLLLQIIVGLIVGLFVLFFRVLYPNGFSNITDSFSEAAQQAQKELAEGNYDGVPNFLQKNMHYPTQEEVKQLKEEERRKTAEWQAYKQMKAEQKKNKKKKK